MKLIFIHGSGSCKESWQYQTEYFTGSEAIDLPGHPDGEPCSSIDDYAEWLHKYANIKEYTDLVIIGHSLGGGIALQYGLNYPDNVKGLICVGSGARLRVAPMFLEGLEKAIAAQESTQAFTDSFLSLVDPELAKSATDDVMTPPKYSQYLADHMQNARAAIVQGGTHFVFAEQPQEVNRAIENFLKAL